MEQSTIAQVCETLEKEYGIQSKGTLIETHSLYEYILLDNKKLLGLPEREEKLRADMYENLNSIDKEMIEQVATHQSNMEEYNSKIASLKTNLWNARRESLLSRIPGRALGIEKLGYRSLVDKLGAQIGEMQTALNKEKEDMIETQKMFADRKQEQRDKYFDNVQHAKISESYPAIDIKFLKLRNDQSINEQIKYIARVRENWSDSGMKKEKRSSHYHISNLPKFAVYNYNSYESTISIHHIFRQKDYKIVKDETKIIMPKIIEETYAKIYNPNYNYINFNLYAGSSNTNACAINADITVKSYFNGLVPQDVKQAIKKAQKYFGDEIYIISEADWKVEKSKVKIDVLEIRDPLVIGISNRNLPGKNMKAAYLISSFQCTPMENYILGRYVEGKSKMN